MSSFRRRLARPFIKGTTTSPQTGQVITGSGNPAFDELLGGGVPMNSVILIEEDKHCIYSKVLCKYFLAEGVIQKQKIFLASLDDSPEEIFKKIPETVWRDGGEVNDSHPEFDQLSMDTKNLRIAWRYNDLPYLNVDKIERHHHHFNLLNYMTEQEIAKVDKVLWDGSKAKDNTSDEDNPKAESLNEEEVEEEDSDDSTSDFTSVRVISFFTNKYFQNLFEDLAKELRFNFCRICIPSLGSPLWYDDNFGEDLLKFLTVLRALVQNTESACFITMPMHLIAKSDETLVPKIRNLVDYSIELESFAGSDHETNPAFKEYNGLLHFRKMSAINSLALFQHSDLAFKLRRKKFVIENFHLPPELGETIEQNHDDVNSSVSNASEFF